MGKADSSVRCIFCFGFVSIKIKQKFEKHMNQDHRVYFNTDFLLEACKLNSVNTEDIKVVKSIMEGMFEENEKIINSSGDKVAVVSSKKISDSTMDVSTSLDEVSEEANNDQNIMNKKIVGESEMAEIPSHLLDEFQKLCDVQDLLSAKKSPTKENDQLENDSSKINNPLRTFDCGECGKSFELSVKLKRHIINKHDNLQIHASKKKTNDCPHCRKTFKFEIMLKRHVESKCKKRKIGKKEFACEFCEESYVSFGNLHRHKRWAHKDMLELESSSSVHSKSTPMPTNSDSPETPSTLDLVKNIIFEEPV